MFCYATLYLISKCNLPDNFSESQSCSRISVRRYGVIILFETLYFLICMPGNFHTEESVVKSNGLGATTGRQCVLIMLLWKKMRLLHFCLPFIL